MAASPRSGVHHQQNDYVCSPVGLIRTLIAAQYQHVGGAGQICNFRGRLRRRGGRWVAVGTAVGVSVAVGGSSLDDCRPCCCGVEADFSGWPELPAAGGPSESASREWEISDCSASTGSLSLLTMKKLSKMALPRIRSRYGRTKAGRVRRTVVRVCFRGAGRLRRSLMDG